MILLWNLSSNDASKQLNDDASKISVSYICIQVSFTPDLITYIQHILHIQSTINTAGQL